MDTRKSNRLQGYDYSQQGVYFLTLCTQHKAPLLWQHPSVGARSARQPVMQLLSEYGCTTQYAIEQIHKRYPMVTVDKYAIMPNHIHLLLVIAPQEGSALRSPTISTIIKQMKGYVTKTIGQSIWQRSFYDHIIRNEADYLTKWNYIEQNPLRWIEDEYYI